MGRIKAASIHLVISVLVFSVFLSLVFFIWYAYPFNLTQGVAEVVYLMAGVDVILGPLLTLIVFNTAKKSLKFDLSVIGFVQLAALLYGGYIIYSERPAWVVFAVDRFEVVGLSEINAAELPDPRLQVGVFDKPKLVYAEPATGELANEILFRALAGGADIDRTPSLYRAIEPYWQRIFAAGQSFSEHPELAQAQQHHSGGLNENRWLPVKGKLRSIVAVLDDKTQQVVEYRNVYPWVDSQLEKPSENSSK